MDSTSVLASGLWLPGGFRGLPGDSAGMEITKAMRIFGSSRYLKVMRNWRVYL
jgi:hypothetical protein